MNYELDFTHHLNSRNNHGRSLTGFMVHVPHWDDNRVWILSMAAISGSVGPQRFNVCSTK